MDNIDEHPLRYAPLTQEIEQVLFRRAVAKELDGYLLATAVEIAELVTKKIDAAHWQYHV